MGSNDHIEVPDPKPKGETVQEFIDRVQAYCDAATDGPWYLGCANDAGLTAIEDGRANDLFAFHAETPEAYFCAQSRTDLPRSLIALKECVEIIRMHAEGSARYDWEGELSRILNGGDEDSKPTD